MKKLFILLLACMMLFLTACNGAPPSETTERNSQNQENIGNPENPLPQGIVHNGSSEMIETPSRIIFDEIVGTPPEKYVFYYSKADGKAYVYCFDPLCDHAGEKCLANPCNYESTISSFELRCTFFINNRFYTATQYGQIYSFAFDGSDLKIEYGDDSHTREDWLELQRTWSPNFRVYDKYIYIPLRADENGKPHTLRFNTETKEMEDLTEKTGNYMNIYFFYRGEIYGLSSDRVTWVKADLELKEMTPIEEQPTTDKFYGSIFFETAYEEPIDYDNPKYLGLKATDIATGETKIFTHEMLGFEDNSSYVIVGTDENYVYFYLSEKTLVGTYIDIKGRELPRYKYNDGKLYRVKHDGTECVCIYDNPITDFTFNSREAAIFDDKIIISGQYVGMRNGAAEMWDNGMKVGTIGPDGKIEKFENIEFVY